MSLSQEPALSVLKNELVCGYRDISKEKYAGFSGKHEVGGNAINTTNGAGPHNLQTFLLASDGTVLHCLPGYWAPQDLVREVQFAGRLYDVWNDPRLSVTQKDQLFRQMQIAHIDEHPQSMVRRSRMQGFDMQYELQNRRHTSDTIANNNVVPVYYEKGMKAPKDGFKTTDRLMHERMASRPFVNYRDFDVAAFADYGRPKYDKNEDYRTANGGVDKDAAKKQEMLGQVPEKKARKKRLGRMMMNTGIRAARMSLR